MRACTKVNVLLLPADLFWYRLHESQEYQSPRAQRDYARVAGRVWRALDAPECPLTPEEREQAKRNRAFHLAKRTLQDLRRGRWTLRLGPAAAVEHDRGRLASLSAASRARRVFAGTPFGADGEFVTPEWVKPSPAVNQQR